MDKGTKEQLEFVTLCGLHCGLCSSRGRIPKQARLLAGSMRKEGWDQWGKEVPGFELFWQFLRSLENDACPGCRQGGGPPFCGIRKCAQKRAVEVCVYCDEWPCRRIKMLAEGYHTLIPDAERMKRIGLTKWLEEQQARAATGFCHCDIRCEPYTVPAD